MIRRILRAIGLVKSDPGACGKERSSRWPAVEKAFLQDNSACAVCGGKSDLNVHHKQPFHLHPELELDPKNLMTLCRPHHLLVGHLMNWASFNKNVEEDAAIWSRKIKLRPSALAAAAALLAVVLLLLPVFATPVEGGPTGPGGVQVTCDLPVEMRLKNTGGRDGAGLCVFTSIEHAGRWQNVAELVGFQQKMTRENGGGYPQKVDAMMKKYSPSARYVQHTGGDLEFLREAINTGRMPCVTYAGKDLHYGARQRIAHMVDLVYLDDKQAAVLDNNFIGEKQLVWMTVAEFRDRWLDMSGGWAIVLLAPSPPPVPKVGAQ